VLLSPAANAAGLGKLTVLSSLGQPLKAEIELTAVSADEAGAIVAKLAPADAFRAANIDFNPTLLSLRFEIDSRNGRQIIRITSGQPVNEPFVDMLLELNWAGGRMVREYTFLLDPAEMRATQSAQVAAPVDVSRGAQPAASAAPAAAPATSAAPAPAARPARPQAAAPAAAEPGAKQAAGEYKVKLGDNLSRIANQVKPVDVSLDMMLVALYRANPEAFSGNNMNRLKSGQILAVPDADAIRGATNEGEARGVVVAHAADFNAYRAKLAGQVATSAPAAAPETTQSTAGKITAKVEERPTAANEAKDQLKLSKATPAASAAGKTGTVVEDKIAKEKQAAEAAARVKELEKNVSDLEKLMAVKSKAMADQKKVAASASASASASTPVIDLNEPAKAAASAPAKPKRTLVVPKSVVEPSIMDTVMDNITYIGGALAALLLGGVGLMAARRRREAKEAEPRVESSLLGDTGMGTQSQQLIAEAGGQSVDTNNSVFNSNFAPSASQLDTNEVDPVAEADVYIAYGRDAQAEEILKEALRTHPERHPVRLKLLEIYANRKDARSFETQASELYSQTRGQGDEWAQAAAMGLALDAANPLYGMGKGEAAPASAPAAEAMDASMFAPPPAVSAAEFVDHFNTQAPESAASDGGLDLDLSQDAAPAGNGMDFASEAETALPQISDFAPAPAPAVPTPAEMAASTDADQFLDFDLGGLSFEPSAPAAAPAAEAAPAAPEVKEEESMFDLAFDTTPVAPIAEAIAPAPAPAPAVEDFGMDFGLDLPAEAVAEKAPEPAPAADPLAALDLMDFNIPEVAAIPAEAAPALSANDFADNLELQGQPETAKAEAPAAPEFDLSGIDLDLSGGADSDTATATERPAVKEETMSAHHMEMDTKLDLAIAYQEIGDKEGARELLDEVIRGGSDDQVAKANAMRAQLG
jgi:pilus assembly protein FimV